MDPKQRRELGSWMELLTALPKVKHLSLHFSLGTCCICFSGLATPPSWPLPRCRTPITVRPFMKFSTQPSSGFEDLRGDQIPWFGTGTSCRFSPTWKVTGAKKNSDSVVWVRFGYNLLTINVWLAKSQSSTSKKCVRRSLMENRICWGWILIFFSPFCWSIHKFPL